MITPTFDISSNRLRSVQAAGAEVDGLRYRLDVVAVDALDAVQSAGGWLYDRAMAGWEVRVRLANSCDIRPLQILGVAGVELNSGYGAGSAARSLAVSAAVFGADADVRKEVLKALDDGWTELALWGDGWPLRVNRGIARAQHVLSAAARSFKRQALVAAGTDCAAADLSEVLLCDRACFSRVDSELIRLG
jgi:hypothetical protein